MSTSDGVRDPRTTPESLHGDGSVPYHPTRAVPAWCLGTGGVPWRSGVTLPEPRAPVPNTGDTRHSRVVDVRRSTRLSPSSDRQLSQMTVLTKSVQRKQIQRSNQAAFLYIYTYVWGHANTVCISACSHMMWKCNIPWISHMLWILSRIFSEYFPHTHT